MSSKDLSHSELIRKRKGLVLRVFKKNNPAKQLEGPNGITSHATYLAMQAYQGSITNLPDVPGCPSVLYSDIATDNREVGAFVLNENTTILACQTLIIPSGINFAVATGKTLINLGTIQIDAVGIFFNTGTIDNAGTFLVNGTTNNTESSVFRNTGSIQITGFFGNTDFTSNLFNTGTIINNTSGNFNNGGRIYNYDGGRITNNGVFNNFSRGNIYNSITLGSCGVGTLDGTYPIDATGTDCPPSS